MEFGVFATFPVRDGQTQHETFLEWLEIGDLCEQVGIDCFWLPEMHFVPTRLLSSPTAVAGALVTRFKRMKVGFAVQVLPLANPVRVAEEVATLDHLSEGRLIFGVGRSSGLLEYRGYSMDYAESRPRFTECLDIIELAWRDEPFSYHGQFYQYDNVNVIPKPYHKPHPPLRIACESRESFSLMGQRGYPVMIRHQMDVGEMKSLLKGYEKARHAAGFSGPNDVTLQTSAYVATSVGKAKADLQPVVEPRNDANFVRLVHRDQLGDDEAYERLSRGLEQGYDERLQRQGLPSYPRGFMAGPPEEIVDRLREYEQTLGVTAVSLDVSIQGGLPHEAIISSLHLLGEKVIPHFR